MGTLCLRITRNDLFFLNVVMDIILKNSIKVLIKVLWVGFFFFLFL